jgi:hypothetical protein
MGSLVHSAQQVPEPDRARIDPSWNEVVRFPPGTRLRVELQLQPALRDAMERASTRAKCWLDALDGATVDVIEVEAERCSLRLQAPTLAAELSATPLASGGYALQARLNGGEQALSNEANEIWLQLGGDHDAYLAGMVDGKKVQVLRLRYAAERGACDLAVFTGAFAGRLPSSARAWLPALIEVAQLRATDGGEQR